MATAATLAEQLFDSSAELLLGDQIPESAEWQDAWPPGLPPLSSLSQEAVRASSPQLHSASSAADHPSSASKFSESAQAHNLSSSWRLDHELDLAREWNEDSLDTVAFATTSRSTQAFPLPLVIRLFSIHQPPTLGRRSRLSLPHCPAQNSHQIYQLGEQILPPDLAGNSLADMPPQRTRSSVDGSASNASAPAPKRRRTTLTRGFHQTAEPLALPKTSDDDPFVDKVKSHDADVNDQTTIDLTEAETASEDVSTREPDRRVKISAFQCAICMDNVTTLTVTHCGHLYCQECLHSSLHVDSTKGKCPMCRAKIDMKPRSTYSSKTKGFWPLELKFMTVDRKGKRKANS
ncbi:hypothetical protein XA68_15873 [Ophiocordyceps unilateralis]|uniref:RING-type domain-containing protein n=1 Tax=Ophiocordyceps unilateralis TaxID=268505 RepID=A0A2A9PPF3_OPHUN|nr:hypothetical protein XA68_15873 [Ophiocordyceps unilateralis]